MLTQDSLDRENASATVLPGAGDTTDLGEGARTGLDGGTDVAVAHDAAVADDHGR
jgi:hypothetical protein